MAEDKDKIAILLTEWKDQNDWQRHNENQRAQLVSILLAISAALVAWIKDRPLTHDDWPIAAFVIGLGVVGLLAVMKYWERYVYHVRREDGLRKELDLYFPNNLLTKAKREAVREHNKGLRPLFKDRHLMQHWLWEGVFVLITLMGVYFLIVALRS